ncbi:MAG: PSD1 and planctomycete cytochrome C domain-containing protein [Planctomycetota bacterium]
MNRFVLFAALVLTSTTQGGEPRREVDFSRDIRPILSGRCFACHGPDEGSREADLRLDQRQGAIEFDAIVPGSAEESLIMERITTDDPDLRMPPTGARLSKEQVESIRNWIDAGAEYESHWAYQKPEPLKLPELSHVDWPRENPIDYFVQQRLVVEGLEPSPPATPEEIVRRLSLDLIGLPPSPEEVEAFASNPSDQNYEQTVDGLLASKHFGEKWALHWLDLARYADSNGYQHDDLRTMWPYRDWVVDAFNNDLPFDQFTIDQLAGDLLPNPSREQMIATGFHRNVPTNFSGGTKVDEIRANVLHDRVSTTGQVWLGMTMECCQCHDHKFDPISQKNYYPLYAYFNQAAPEFAMEGPGMFRKKFVEGNLDVVSSDKDHVRLKAIERQLEFERVGLENAKSVALADQDTWEIEFRNSDQIENIPWGRFPWYLRGGARALEVPRPQRSDEQEVNLRALLFYYHEITRPYELSIDRLKAARDELVAKTMVMRDSDQKVVTHLFMRGNYLTPGEEVEAGVPDVLHDLDADLPSNRLGFAKWLVDPENPLMARVTANRFWAEIFGRGIVTTPNDFGMQSSPPSHPELLDWLALEFQRNDWSMKDLIKTIVMSSTYRQSAAGYPNGFTIDPANELLARGPRLRLSGELIRDNALAISGLLSTKIGGPAVYPPQPKGLWGEISGADVKDYPTSTGEDRYRRGLYTFLRRGNPNPMILNFDGSDRSACIVKRDRSNTPVQALSLLNGPTFVDAARAFAQWIDAYDGNDRDKSIVAFKRAVARPPTNDEIEALLGIYRKHQDWFSVAQVILNLDETMTK